MPRCAGFKPSNSPCERIVGASQTYCYSHDPTRAADRSKNAARAGRARGSSGEVASLKAMLQELYDSVLRGGTDPKIGAVCVQVCNSQMRLLNLELDIREREELTQRIEALEAGL